MNSKQFDKLSAISKKLNSKNKDPKNFKKLLRLKQDKKIQVVKFGKQFSLINGLAGIIVLI
jgi:hypothetical protein